MRSLLLVSVMGLVVACTQPPPSAIPSGQAGTPLMETAPGQWLSGSHTNPYGTRSYRLYVPSGTGAKPLPLVVMLHGCTQTADDFAAGTTMNSVAESHGFLVVYPEQDPGANGSRCWNWFDPAHQARGGGEPSLIAGIVNDVKLGYRVNENRIYAAGMSAGGAMAVLLGASYPDLVSALGVHSGLEYRAASDAASGVVAQALGGPSPLVQGEAAYRAMGSVRGRTPVIVFHGALDPTVQAVNGHQVLSQWARTNDLGDDGVPNGSVDDVPEREETGQTPAGYHYTRSVHENASGAVLMEKWIVHELLHAWSGGSSMGSYSNTRGPNASQQLWRFFSESASGPPAIGDDVPPVLAASPAGGTYVGPTTVTLSLNEPGR
ncbi:MAG TPA: PHB depolymerase family esterase, partial [Myxococcaceae bacterium]|nr:PHB depolymerase family esterase [Myxococcaceae bacterium]